MVSHLEQVDRRQTARQQHRVHVFLGIAGQQEAPAVKLAQQHH